MIYYDFFGVSSGRLEMQLVKRRAAPERESFAKNRARENLNQRPANDQILLDLEVLDLRRFRPPFRDEVARDHSSASTFALT